MPQFLFLYLLSLSLAIAAQANDCEKLFSAEQIRVIEKVNKSWEYSIRLFEKRIADKPRLVVLVQESPIKNKAQIQLGRELLEQYRTYAIESNQHQNVFGRSLLNGLFKKNVTLGLVPGALYGRRAQRLADIALKETPGTTTDLEADWQPIQRAQVGSAVIQVVGIGGLLASLAGATIGFDALFSFTNYLNEYWGHLADMNFEKFFLQSPLHQLGVYDLSASQVWQIRHWWSENQLMVSLTSIAIYFGFKDKIRTAMDLYPPRAFSRNKAEYMTSQLNQLVVNGHSNEPVLVLLDSESGSRVAQGLIKNWEYNEVPLENVLDLNDTLVGDGAWSRLKRKLRRYKIAYERWADKNLPDDDL